MVFDLGLTLVIKTGVGLFVEWAKGGSVFGLGVFWVK